ncbi:hypothetical protein EVAR_82283_1 [Eumeta japonica]|uniref:Uncharacterized protein n=1 Tax=Eumeta variegata TaxID=151549 RepID=A0A4C1VYG4_EUMVA|nr:hypothetical protein EVAR_82283_1 [Eumeta japonica]
MGGRGGRGGALPARIRGPLHPQGRGARAASGPVCLSPRAPRLAPRAHSPRHASGAGAALTPPALPSQLKPQMISNENKNDFEHRHEEHRVRAVVVLCAKRGGSASGQCGGGAGRAADTRTTQCDTTRHDTTRHDTTALPCACSGEALPEAVRHPREPHEHGQHDREQQDHHVHGAHLVPLFFTCKEGPARSARAAPISAAADHCSLHTRTRTSAPRGSWRSSDRLKGTEPFVRESDSHLTSFSSPLRSYFTPLLHFCEEFHSGKVSCVVLYNYRPTPSVAFNVEGGAATARYHWRDANSFYYNFTEFLCSGTGGRST